MSGESNMGGFQVENKEGGGRINGVFWKENPILVW